MASAFLCGVGMERLCSGRRDTAPLHPFSVLERLPGNFSCPSQFCHSRFMQLIDLNYCISFLEVSGAERTIPLEEEVCLFSK